MKALRALTLVFFGVPLLAIIFPTVIGVWASLLHSLWTAVGGWLK